MPWQQAPGGIARADCVLQGNGMRHHENERKEWMRISRRHDGQGRFRLRMPAAALLAALCLGLAGTAFAQQGSEAKAQALKQACAADYKALCSGVQPGGGRIIACLKQNADKLSPTCRQALGDAKAAKQARGAAQ